MPVNKLKTLYKPNRSIRQADKDKIINCYGKYSIFLLTNLPKHNYKSTNTLDCRKVVLEISKMTNELKQQIPTITVLQYATIIKLAVQILDDLLCLIDNCKIKIDTIVCSYLDSISFELKEILNLANFINSILPDDPFGDIILQDVLVHIPVYLVGFVANTYNIAIELNLVSKKFYKKILNKQNDCIVQLNVLRGIVCCLVKLKLKFNDEEISGFINHLIVQIKALLILSKSSCNYIISDFLNFINYEIQLLIQLVTSTKEEIFIPLIFYRSIERLIGPMQNIGILARKLRNQRKKYSCSQKSASFEICEEKQEVYQC